MGKTPKKLSLRLHHGNRKMKKHSVKVDTNATTPPCPKGGGKGITRRITCYTINSCEFANGGSNTAAVSPACYLVAHGLAVLGFADGDTHQPAVPGG